MMSDSVDNNSYDENLRQENVDDAAQGINRDNHDGDDDDDAVNNTTNGTGIDPDLGFDPSTTPLTSLNSTQLRALLNKKQKQMQQWESDIADAMNTLAAQGNVGMNQRLVDSEGFPRDDIDVTAVRQARNTVALRRNDLVAIGEDLKRLLELIFAAHAKESGTSALSVEEENLKREAARKEKKKQREEQAAAALAAQQRKQQQNNDTNDDDAGQQDGKKLSKKAQAAKELAARWAGVAPLCIVRDVLQNSPAFLAGLRDQDGLIGIAVDVGTPLKKDDLTYAAVENIAEVAALVRENEGVPLRLVLARQQSGGGVGADGASSATAAAGFVETVMVPQKWSGSGLLGCALDPVVVAKK